MTPEDILCIMTLLKSAGDQKIISDNANSARPSRGKSSKHSEDDNSQKEVPYYILECFKVLITNLTEREDIKRQELKDEFLEILAEKDAKI